MDQNTQKDQTQTIKDSVFENFKKGLLQNKNLLEKFLKYSKEHSELEFTEFSTEEQAQEALRRADKIRDKLLSIVEEENNYILEVAETNTLVDMIIAKIDAQGYQCKVIIEVYDEGFNLEVV